MKKLALLFITGIILLLSAVFFTFSISKELDVYHHKKIEIAEKMNFEVRLLEVWEYIPLFGYGDEKVEEYKELDKQATLYYKRAIFQTVYYLIIVLLFVIVNRIYYRNHEEKYRVSGLIYVLASIAFLYLGLHAPFLEIEAYNKDLYIDLSVVSHTFEGRTYYLYQNKSILQLISMLYLGGNFLVAIVILFFSIVFPIIKLSATLIVFLTPNSRYSLGTIKVINALGKWSMADVFVAAVFLAYFSFANMNEGVDTGATTLLGTYYFLTFVIFSIISGSMLKKYVKKRHGKSISDLALEEH